MNLEDFLPTYPGYEMEPLFSIYKEELTSIIQRKKEFLELTLDESEPRPEKAGELLKHQLFLQRFMSGHTPYNGVLLWHSVGTGKTGSSIAIAEGLKHFNGSFQKTLILVRSTTFVRNFKNEIAYVMTDGEYLPKNLEKLTEGEKTRRINKLISDYYEFNTFQVFAKQYSSALDKQRFLQQYANRLIIIDEVHNIRKTKSGTYDAIHEFLHGVKDSKIVLLTATPIKDQASEFASVMNLILPEDKQLKTGSDFMTFYFKDWNLPLDQLLSIQIGNAKKNKLIESIKGRISYLQPTRSDVQVIEAGTQLPFSPFPQVECPMSEHQASLFLPHYNAETGKEEEDAEKEEEEEDEDGEDKASSLYKKSIQAAMCVSEGEKFSRKVVMDKLKAVKDSVSANPIEKYSNKLEVLKKYSCKYYYILQQLLSHPDHASFVYCTDIKDAGINALREILTQFGFNEVSAGDTLSTPSKRFAVITGKTVEGFTEFVLKEFNKSRNSTGDYIQLVIGSAAIGEGRSLLSVRDIFIVTPHWNLTDMDQAIGRGIRFGSHRYLPPIERKVTIHRLRAVTPDGKSIDDYITRVAYTKDVLSKKIEAIARTAAIDCDFNFKRNLQLAQDYSRQCLYQECDYKCAVPTTEEKPIEDTYNLFYTEKEYQAVKRILQEIFSKTFKYPIRDILSRPELQAYSSIVVLRSITSIVERRELFTNPLGFPNYLKERGDSLVLSHDAAAAADPAYDYDTKLGQLFPKIGFKEFLHNFILENLDDVLSTIESRLGEDSAKELFDSLPLDIRLELLRQCLPKKADDSPLVKFIQKRMISDYKQEEDTILIPKLQEEYSFDTGKWSFLGKIVDNQANIDFNERLEKNEIEYYGILEEGKFKIVSLGNRKGTVPTSLERELLGEIHASILRYYLSTLSDPDFKESVKEKGEKIAGESTKPPVIRTIQEMMTALNLILSRDEQEAFYQWRTNLKGGNPK